MKKLFIVLMGAVLLAALLALPASAMEYFTISDYDIKVDISEKNTYHITETVTVQFTEPRHGIYRDIPYQGTWLRDDSQGGSTSWRAKVSDIAVDGYKYDVSRSDGKVEIKIGDPDSLVDGTQVYRISYSMQFYDDGLPNADEVYYNLIGTDWATTIDHVTFSVTLPKSFDPATLGFSLGTEGTWGYDPSALKVTLDGSTITGEVTQQLQSNEALTIRMTLPQGYFTIPFQGGTDFALLIFIAILVVLAFILFFLYGRDSQIVQTVEFYAPDGMTPSEVGYVIDGVVDNRDVVSLVIYWAHRGYLSIEDTGSSTFILHKLRDLGPDAKPFEYQMFNRLFAASPSVSSSSLKNTFYTTIASTKKMISDAFKSDASRIFTKTSSVLRPLLSLMTALPIMVTLFLMFYRDLQDFAESAIIAVAIGLAIMIPAYIVIGHLRKWRAKKRVSRVVGLFVGLIISFAAIIVFVVLTYDKVYIPALPWCAALATVLLGIVASFIEKRTPKGAEWMGKICGFRDFLELAERDKLVALVDQDPKYFYNILPYAWVLNVSDKWAKKFETIAIQPPDWYYGHTGMFYPVVFMNDLNHSMNAMTASMTSSPSSSSGGGSGFSGGGFSGGGGGGGGGGSW
jgi:uncharacterized membrane protein